MSSLRALTREKGPHTWGFSETRTIVHVKLAFHTVYPQCYLLSGYVERGRGGMVENSLNQLHSTAPDVILAGLQDDLTQEFFTKGDDNMMSRVYILIIRLKA